MTEPTDTNQASELYELCKEVYRLTYWRLSISERPVEYWVQHDDEWDLEYGVVGIPVDGGVVPLYTSDYLLERLPATLNDDEGDTYRLTVCKVGDGWLANYVYDNVGMWHRYGTTPLKALLKLTITLSEAGELE